MPKADDTQSYSDFANKFWKDDWRQGKMDDEVELLAREYLNQKSIESEHKQNALEISNKIKSIMRSMQVLENDDYKITWKEATDGSRRFKVKKKD